MAVAERELPTLAQKSEEPEEEFKPLPYRWTREQFYQMGDMGLFEGRRAILIEGEILAMPAMGRKHRTAIILADEMLRGAFGKDFFLSVQCPFDIGEATDPEPDIAIVRGGARDFLGRGLTDAALIVEVSDTTHRYDRREKASLYAKAGVSDYWIVNLDKKPPQLEVYRQPKPDEAQPYGHGYGEVNMYQAGEMVLPLAASSPVAVSALLP